MPSNEAKVTYLTREGYVTQAYIDLETGIGESKHTGIPVKVQWDDDRDIWVQIDDWEWRYDEFNGIWLPTNLPPLPSKPPHIRKQPKRLTRRQRKQKN